MLTKVNTEIAQSGPWDVKYRKGGMMELAFIAEALQLIHGPANPSLFRANTAEAIRALRACRPSDGEDGAMLLAADFLWRTIQGIDRITGLRDQDLAPPPAMLAPLLRATGAGDLSRICGPRWCRPAMMCMIAFTRLIASEARNSKEIA
jgi:glutamate-ammonia-ligase adenylyltransferase